MNILQFIGYLILLFLTSITLEGQSYPWPTDPPTEADQFCFYKRECTSYAAFRMNYALGYTPDPGEQCEDFPFRNDMCISGVLSHAAGWDDCLPAAGYLVNSDPRVGAIAHWEAGEGDTVGIYGHVAVVTNVHGDGTVDILEYNWVPAHELSVRKKVRASSYLHYYTADHLALSDFDYDDFLIYQTYNSIAFSNNTVKNDADIRLKSNNIIIGDNNVVKDGGRLVGQAEKVFLASGNSIKVEPGGYAKIVGVKEYIPAMVGHDQFEGISAALTTTERSTPDPESNIDEVTFAVFPNPVKNDVNINLMNATEQSLILRIMDGMGRLIQVENYESVGSNFLQQLSLGHLPNGIYFLQMELDNGKKLTRKIIKSDGSF